ncbi:MAG: phosphoribosylanthranilate isomerase [Candidatus Ranarchaeia archaeon]
MSVTRVKICGIKTLGDLRIAVDAGADAIGCIVGVPNSPRNISIKCAKQIIEAVPPFISSVAVTVSENPETVLEIYERIKPDYIQIHGIGNKAKQLREQLPQAKIIGAVAVNGHAYSTIIKTAPYYDVFLLDSHVTGQHGGTGSTHDWAISSRMRKLVYPKPLILAGGLTYLNVREAIKIVNPYAVDVASGVESEPGKKDPRKLVKFMKTVKEM